MTRFSVNLKNILGLSFYRYNISADTYNPTIDTNVTVTCKVTNIFGTPIANKTVTLLMDNAHIIITENNTTTDISEQTTDTNGEATWTIPITDWELHNLTIATNTIYIQAKGWRETGQGLTNVEIYRNKENAKIIFKGRSQYIGTSWTAFGGSPYCADVKPSRPITSYLNGDVYICRIDGQGNIELKTTTSGTYTLYGQIDWSIGE